MGGAIAGAGRGEGYKIAVEGWLGVGGGHCAFCLRLASFQSPGEEMWSAL